MILLCNISCADLAHFQNVIVQFVLLYIEIQTVLSAQEVRDRIETLYYCLDHDNNTTMPPLKTSAFIMRGQDQRCTT